MTLQEFLSLYELRRPQVLAIENAAGAVHASVNQHYEKDLPYSFHLRLAASYLTKYGHQELTDASEFDTLYAAVYFHDSMEDARMTYNDVKAEFERLNKECGCDIHVVDAAEMVYALTNDKGRTRAERAGEAYYAGIRETAHAPFLKMCDRLANMKFSTLFYPISPMVSVYEKELGHFLESITKGAKTGVPEAMVEELKGMF
ncbi:MAG: phosphodiesterase [Bacteroidaceae bacterium]|nr:phosphodiesterase [Bacteroidaceae bacterium]